MEAIQEAGKQTKTINNKKCEHGREKRYCKECGGTAYCHHGKVKYRCKECGGSSICDHGLVKCLCKECGGTALCEHSKQKHQCNICKGPSYCIHDRLKYLCRECGGEGLCEHGKQKSRCELCGGIGVCEHGKRRSRCKDCGGKGLCEHGREKYSCKECGGAGICEHNRLRHQCKECGGASICEHNLLRNLCKECGGTSICIHEKVKTKCKECGGSALCKSAWCEKTGNKKYDGYCLFCFTHLFPDNAVVRNYKTKENDVVCRIKEKFPDFSWVADKRVSDGCSKRRPDLLLDLGSHIIIIEVDENKHAKYDNACENKRLMELSQDLQHRPIVFIRFNPDSYTDVNGKVINSCWKVNGHTGLLVVPSTKKEEWNDRIEVLIKQVQLWVDTVAEKTIEIVELFY